MATPAPPQAELFAKLDSQIQSGQRKKALRTVDEVLKINPNDRDAKKSKVYLLIDLDRCQEALTLIEKSKIVDGLHFEKAYCLYRLGELDKSLTALNNVEAKDVVSGLQLRAQIQHKLGQFETAVETYNDLATTHKVATPDVKTNLLAACINNNSSTSVKAVLDRLQIKPSDGYEVAYNLACFQIANNDVEAAKETLQFALRLGRESLMDDDLNEEQVNEELIPVSLQMAYTEAVSGQHEQALHALEEITGIRGGDEGGQAVALNNKIAERVITTHPDLVRSAAQESIKELDTYFEKGASGLQLKSAVEGRLTPAQQQILYTNRVLLLILAGRIQSAKDVTQRLSRRFKDSTGIQLLRVSLATLGGKPKDAQQILENASQGDPSRHVKLIQAQLAAQARDFEQAYQILTSLDSKNAEPALISSRCSLLEAAGREADALELLQASQNQGTGESQGRAEQSQARKAVLPMLARLQLKAGAVSDAFQTFKELQNLDRNTAGSAAVIGQLAAAAVENDPRAASDLGDNLEPLPSIAAETVSNLEAAGAGRMAKAESSKRAANAESGAEPKRKRKRQKRLPKNFDPENPGPMPDPERWLPKWQRAEFRRKRRNRNTKDSKKGHQGGAVDESLDRTNTETPAAQPNLPKRGQRGRGKSGKR